MKNKNTFYTEVHLNCSTYCQNCKITKFDFRKTYHDFTLEIHYFDNKGEQHYILLFDPLDIKGFCPICLHKYKLNYNKKWYKRIFCCCY